jgi:hypothetical protein
VSERGGVILWMRNDRPTFRALVALGGSLAVIAGALGGAASAPAAAVPVTPVPVPVVTVAGPTSIDQLSVADTDVIGYGQEGMAVAAWRTFDGSNWRIAVSTDLGSGAWTSPQLISPQGVDAELPSAGAATSDDWTTVFGSGIYQQVAWRLATGEIQLAWKQQSDSSWSAPLTISEAGSDTADPLSMVTYHDEREGFVPDGSVVWLGKDRAHWRVHYLSWPYWRTPRLADVRLLSPAGHDAADASASPRRVAWSLYEGAHWWVQTEEVGEYGANTVETAPKAPGEDALTPQVGDFGLLWTSSVRGHVRLRASLRPGYEKPLSKPVTVSTPGADVTDVHLVSSRPHHVQAIWLEGDAGGARRVATSWADPRTNQWQPPTYLSPAGVDADVLVVSAIGDSWSSVADAAWTETAGGPHQVFATEWKRSSGWSTATAVTPADTDAVTPFPIAIGWGADHTSGVAWVQSSAPGSKLEVEGYDSRGPNTQQDVTHRYPFSPARVTWRSVDDWSPVTASQMRTWTTSLGASSWDSKTETLDGSTTSRNVTLAEGTSGCFAVRGVDALGRIGTWPALDFFSCASAPADDGVFTTSAGWRPVAAGTYFDGSALRATQAGSMVSVRLVGAENEKLLVAKGPGNGTIRISFSGHQRVVSLNSPVDKRRVWVRVATFYDYGYETSRLRVTVLSHGRPVRIDGLYAEQSRWH